ncbi:hypothetical protein QE152_g17964 [Popillia japonica]|uniref:Uncharacterized protein n=1 Tax=Popillia japonica TaxID=7064 RepID=A0AAW1L531_POPJA
MPWTIESQKLQDSDMNCGIRHVNAGQIDKKGIRHVNAGQIDKKTKPNRNYLEQQKIWEQTNKDKFWKLKRKKTNFLGDWLVKKATRS